ncbi:hypothetical protein FACS189456_0180 [Bacteroidia bacterium]|nr:hypothetical protein FACS189456_0180 [Bacteroidia bacterium]
MALSMTGYGIAAAKFAEKQITVELRSLNSKQMDVNFRTPPVYRELEADLRALLQELQRGKIDVQITCKCVNASPQLVINETLFLQYLLQFKAIAAAQHADLQISAGDILALPGVIDTQDAAPAEDEKKVLLDCFSAALQSLIAFRKQEGEALIRDILQHVQAIEQLLMQIEPFENERVGNVKIKLQQALAVAVDVAQIDNNRLEQELIYYLEKFDVTEEKTRLRHHCLYFAQTVKEENAGRKLGFIAQEMGREINTLGSKSNHSQMQHIVVQMKDELEKIKEQLLNIL